MLQQNNSRKQNSRHSSFIKTAAYYCVVFLVAFVFFLQQLAAFSLSNKTITNSKNRFEVAHAGKAPVQLLFSVHLPYQTSPIGFEMEVELAEEDDTKNDLEEFCNNLAAIHAIEEQVYTSYLRSRYLQIASSVHDQPAIPFFILYHSWKNHLA